MPAKTTSKGLFKPAGSNVWHYEFQLNGARYRSTTKLADRREAEKVLRRAREEAVRRDALLRPGAAGEPRNMLQATAAWWERTGSKRKGNYRLTTERICHELVEMLGPETMLADIDDETVSALFDAIRERPHHGKRGKVGLAPITVDAYAAALNDILRNAARREPLPDLPDLKPYRGESAVRTREPTEDELERLAEVLPPEIADVVDFMVETGLRGMSVFGITWSDVVWEAGVIHVTVKWGRSAEVPITPAVQEILERVEGRHPSSLFVRRAGPRDSGRGGASDAFVPLTRGVFNYHFRKGCEAAKIADLEVHDLRRYFGATLLRATSNLQLVSRAMHHKSIAVTAKVYAHVLTKDIRDGMATATKYRAKRRRAAKERALAGERRLAGTGAPAAA